MTNTQIEAMVRLAQLLLTELAKRNTQPTGTAEASERRGDQREDNTK